MFIFKSFWATLLDVQLVQALHQAWSLSLKWDVSQPIWNLTCTPKGMEIVMGKSSFSSFTLKLEGVYLIFLTSSIIQFSMQVPRALFVFVWLCRLPTVNLIDVQIYITWDCGSGFIWDPAPPKSPELWKIVHVRYSRREGQKDCEGGGSRERYTCVDLRQFWASLRTFWALLSLVTISIWSTIVTKVIFLGHLQQRRLFNIMCFLASNLRPTVYQVHACIIIIFWKKNMYIYIYRSTILQRYLKIHGL